MTTNNTTTFEHVGHTFVYDHKAFMKGVLLNQIGEGLIPPKAKPFTTIQETELSEIKCSTNIRDYFKLLYKKMETGIPLTVYCNATGIDNYDLKIITPTAIVIPKNGGIVIRKISELNAKELKAFKQFIVLFFELYCLSTHIYKRILKEIKSTKETLKQERDVAVEFTSEDLNDELTIEFTSDSVAAVNNAISIEEEILPQQWSIEDTDEKIQQLNVSDIQQLAEKLNIVLFGTTKKEYRSQILTTWQFQYVDVQQEIIRLLNTKTIEREKSTDVELAETTEVTE